MVENLLQTIDESNMFDLIDNIIINEEPVSKTSLTEAIRYHQAYNAEYGRPIKGLMVPDQHRLSEDVANLVAQAQGLYGGGVIILPQFSESQQTANFDLKLVEAKSRGFQTFADLAKVCRDLITLYLVGVLETTGGSSASNAKAQTQLRVADRYTTADARIREDAISRILRCWADFNGFVDAPRYVINTDPPADEAHRAAVAKSRAAAIKATAEALKAMSDWVTIDEPRVVTLMKEIGVDFETQRPQPLNPYIAAGSQAAMERAGDSIMVCWAVPSELARVLAVPGGEAPEELHLTLALCQGGLPDVLAAMVAVIPTLTAVDGFVQGVASWPVGGGGGGSVDVGGDPLTLPITMSKGRDAGRAARSTSMAGQVQPGGGGEGDQNEGLEVPQGSLNTDDAPHKTRKLNIQLAAPATSTAQKDDGQVAYVSLVDAPALADMRTKIVKALLAIGVNVQDRHGFIPHITRAYLPAGASIASPPDSYPIHIGELSVWALGGRIRVPMGLPDEEEHAINELSDEALGQTLVQLSSDLDVLELRTFQRDARGRFGHGGGLGSAAKSHSETAHKQNTVDAHRKAARANVAVARTALKRGDVQKAKEHLEAAKVHQNKVKGFKMEQPTTAPLKKLEKVSDWKKVGGDKQAKEWTQKLDPDEISALKIYTGEAYASINKDLRTHKGKIVDEEDNPHLLTIMNMDAALQRGRTSRAMVVSRQLSGDVPGLEKGAVFRDHGYMSTSVGGKFDAPTGKTQVQMNILVPKGSKGGFLSMSKYPDEKEFLLPRGSRLKIVDSKTKDGVKHVYAHLIQD